MPRLPKPGADFKPAPEGTWPAVCVRIVEMGTQPQNYQGKETPPKEMVRIYWELHDEECMIEREDDDGNRVSRPMVISRPFTWSTSPRASLRKLLESWRGKPFTDADFGPDGFEIADLLGAPCLLQVQHNERDGTTYANVGNVIKLAKGMEKPKPVLTPTGIWLDRDTFDQEAFEKLGEGVRNKVMSSPEYQEMIAAMGANEDEEEDVPF